MRIIHKTELGGGLAVAEMVPDQSRTGSLSEVKQGYPKGKLGVIDATGRWILEPQWHTILEEYWGYYYVQDSAEQWAVVGPDGTPITPFVTRTERQGIPESIRFQMFRQLFRWWQFRSMEWTIEAAQTGSLGIFSGKIPNPFASREVPGPWGIADKEPIKLLRSRTDLEDGCTLVWNSTSLSAGFDTLCYCPVKIQGEIGNPPIPIPWEDLALALPASLNSRSQFGGLEDQEHTKSLRRLITEVVMLSDALHQWALSGTEELYDLANDALTRCEQFRGIVMNLLVTIEIPGGNQAPKSIIEDVNQRLTKCDFPRMREIIANLPPDEVTNAEEATREAYQSWELLFNESCACL